jgi:aldose 1-epimerase
LQCSTITKFSIVAKGKIVGKKQLWLTGLVALVTLMMGTTAAVAAGVKVAPYGVTQDGRAVTAYILFNDKGASVTVLNYGGTIAAIRVPDRQGTFANVAMSFADMTGWETVGHWANADIGRYANVILGGFTLDGVHYPLTQDARGTTMHSGPETYARRLWTVQPIKPKDGAALTLTMDSPDGDQGFPGHAMIKVTYTFSNQNALQLEWTATTDKATPINLTNHLYINLNGNSTTSVCDADMQVMTDQAAAQTRGVPGANGEIGSIIGTPFDFTQPTPLKERLGICNASQSIRPAPQPVPSATQPDRPTAQLDSTVQPPVRTPPPPLPPGMVRSFNEPFILHDSDRRLDRVAARLHDPLSGRIMEIRTTELSVHVYTPASMEAALLSDAGKPFTRVPSIAFETQHLPDSPNHPEYPTTVLRPGQVFHSTTIFTFTTDAKR